MVEMNQYDFKWGMYNEVMGRDGIILSGKHIHHALLFLLKKPCIITSYKL